MFRIMLVFAMAFWVSAQNNCASCEQELEQCKQDESDAINRGTYTSSISNRCQRILARCIKCRQNREEQERQRYVQKQKESSKRIAQLGYQMNENAIQYINSLNDAESNAYGKIQRYINLMDSTISANCYKQMTAQMLAVDPYNPYGKLMDPTYSDPLLMSQKANSCVASTFMNIANNTQALSHVMKVMEIPERYRQVAYNSFLYTISAKYGF